jgi:hypothetical protein
MPWEYDQKEYDKQAAADPVWKLERQICYGRPGEKLDPLELKQYWPRLKIPSNRRTFLALLLWDRPF